MFFVCLTVIPFCRDEKACVLYLLFIRKANWMEGNTGYRYLPFDL